MKYRLIVLDFPSNTPIVFKIALENEKAVVETGAGWLRRFPNDIVMVVEEPI